METRANYVLIGAFTLAVIAGAFGFVYWFHHVGGTGARAAYRVVFQGPISGLRTGAAVVFNGIRVGEVTELGIDPGNPKQAVAVMSIDAATPVRADTRVALDFQGLTGIAALALRGGSASAPALAAKDGQLPVLTADLGTTQDVMAAARDVLGRFDSIVAQNEESLQRSIRNIEIFTDTLARNSERLDRILAGVQGLVGDGAGNGDLSDAARAIKSAADNLDKRVDELAADGRRTLSTIDRTMRNFDRNPQRLLFGDFLSSANDKKKAR
jgi:phospholipid/cholesterol/gamma-HCH transport system substrate-binding protein